MKRLKLLLKAGLVLALASLIGLTGTVGRANAAFDPSPCRV